MHAFDLLQVVQLPSSCPELVSCWPDPRVARTSWLLCMTSSAGLFVWAFVAVSCVRGVKAHLPSTFVLPALCLCHVLAAPDTREARTSKPQPVLFARHML